MAKTTRDMTHGPILGHMIAFALPLMLGNVFQLLYNTVDTLVVGKYVSTQALAAVGSTTMIVNMMVFFFNGLSIGAGVVISRHFGAGDMKKLHTAIETTMAMTFGLGVLFSVIGVLIVKPMLLLMATPADVMADATIYLQIYLGGILGLMVYNMGSGILRAVGDTVRPLYFLILTSVANILLDLCFVLVWGMGIEGVALATIISQFISAFLTLYLLSTAKDVYRLTWNDLRLDLPTLEAILTVGLPAAIQSTVTAFSNVLVQSYVNFFGSAVMAGWSCYNKLDQFVFLPMNSLASAATTFVSQNVGAEEEERADRGTVQVLLLTVGVTGAIILCLVIFANPATRIFTDDPKVVTYSVFFIRITALFLLLNCVNHTLAGALRGHGDSKGPMFIMLFNFVAVRQAYLFVMTRFVANTTTVIGLAYPVGWTCCCIMEVTYFLIRRKRKK